MAKKVSSSSPQYTEALNELGNVLELLGLDRDQSDTYAAMLKSGARPASMIAKIVGFGRGKTYDILRTLLENNLIQEFTKNGVKQFAALPGHMVLSILKNREEKFRGAQKNLMQIVPFLESTEAVSIDQAKVEFWRGDEALQTMWERLIRIPDTTIYGFFDYEKRWPANRGEAMQEWDRTFSEARANNNVTMAVICNRSPASDKAFLEGAKNKRTMKVIENISIPIAVLVHPTALIITNNTREVYGVVIRDESLIRSAQQIFQSVWPHLPDYSI